MAGGPPGHPLGRVPAPALFVFSGLTQYVGAAIAVGLFTRVGPAQVAWLRVLLSAVVLVLWQRPWRRRRTRRELVWAGVFGTTLALMNTAFYVAISHLPLGTAVAIEFVGPVVVAAIAGRGVRERGAIAFAAAGVLLLAGVSLESGDIPRADALVGLVAITVAAGCWAAYIVVGKRVAATGTGVTSLAVGMGTGALVLAPFLAPTAAWALADPRLAVALLGVAVFSSVVPYAMEQVILRRVSAATFSVLTALLPATAMVVGAVVLRQVPSPADLAGLALVSVAIVMTAHRNPRPARRRR